MAKNTGVLILCIIVGIAVLCGLGTWQLKRLAWKNALIARVEAALQEAPISLQSVSQRLNNGNDIEFRPAEASGRFLHDKEQHYFATHKGASGYFVYTPLELSNKAVLFVNRGFVPVRSKQADTRSQGLVTGGVDIVGLARSAPTEKPNSFVPDNDLVKNIFYWKSLAQMSARAFPTGEQQILPFFLDAGPENVAGGLPVGGVTRISFPNSHLQYAVTWFGLALALFCVGGLFVVGRIRGTQQIS